MKNEIDHVIGQKAEISYDDVNRLIYLDAVLKETLRLFPAGAQFDRISTKPFKINDYEIPIGTRLIVKK